MNPKIINLPMPIHGVADCAKELAERFLSDAITTATKRLYSENLFEGTNYNAAAIVAKEHPAIVAGFMQAEALAFQALVQNEGVHGVRNILDTMCDQFGELLSLIESADATQTEISTANKRLADAAEVVAQTFPKASS